MPPGAPGPYGCGSEWPPSLLKHVGVWEGTFRRLDPYSGRMLDRHRAKLEIGVRGSRWAQRNTYMWDDGREVVYEFAAEMRNGNQIYDNHLVEGYTIPIGDGAILFYGKRKGTDEDVYETIRLLTDTSRIRTWQILKEGKTVEIMQVDEQKTSNDNMYFEA